MALAVTSSKSWHRVMRFGETLNNMIHNGWERGTQSQQCSSFACQGITPVNQASQQNSERFIIHRPVFEQGLGWQYSHCKFFALILPLRKYMVSFLSEENQNKITETLTRKNNHYNPFL